MKSRVSVIVLSFLALKATVVAEPVGAPTVALRFDEPVVLSCAARTSSCAVKSTNGIKRTDYRDIAKELTHSLGMNYAFGVEFVDVDRLEDPGALPRLER